MKTIALRTTLPRVSFTLIRTLIVWFTEVTGFGENVTWSTTRRWSFGTSLASTDFSPFGSVITPLFGLSCTGPVAVENASALPRLFLATTLRRSVFPTSLSTGVYSDFVLPLIGLHALPAGSQRSHW